MNMNTAITNGLAALAPIWKSFYHIKRKRILIHCVPYTSPEPGLKEKARAQHVGKHMTVIVIDLVFRSLTVRPEIP